MITPLRSRSTGRLAVSAALVAALVSVAVACGDDDGSTATDGGATAGTAIERGENISRSRGCAGCHGSDFDGGAGPTWVGLAGSEVVLADGSTVVADEAYLVRSIADPSADLREGYTLRMPANNLTDDEIADVVAYIESLADG